MTERDRILVFIPAYRCAAQVVRVLDQFRATEVHTWFEEIVVFDNDSPDTTVQAAIARAQEIGIGKMSVYRNRSNYGLGGSHKAAFFYALDRGFTHVVTLHGDDQGDVRDLIPILQAGEHHRVDCCLGARFHPGSRISGYSRLRVVGNHLFNALFSLATQKRLYDLGSGLNLYAVPALGSRYWLRFRDDLTFNYCMILAHAHRNDRLLFFPMSWREDDQVSNVKLLSQAWRTMRLLGRYRMDPKSFMAQELRAHPRASYPFDVLLEKA